MDEPWDDFERKSTREEVFVLFRGDQERVERKVRKSQITIERLSMMPDWNLCSARGKLLRAVSSTIIRTRAKL